MPWSPVSSMDEATWWRIRGKASGKWKIEGGAISPVGHIAYKPDIQRLFQFGTSLNFIGARPSGNQARTKAMAAQFVIA